MAVTPSIREPDVEIFQQTVSEVTATPRIGLAPVCVAANYAWIRAQDGDDNFQSTALMGTYSDQDATITYALPNLEDGATFDDESLRVWMSIGNENYELDDEEGETIVIDSTATSVAPAGAYYDLSDPLQVFNGAGGSGIVAAADPSEADYAVRMEGVDGSVHDFPIQSIVDPQTLRLDNAQDGLIAPSTTVLSYQVILNPTKFVVNAAAIAASLRVDSVHASYLLDTATGDVTFTANTTNFPGNDGNSITVDVQDTGAAGISVSGLDIVITIDAGVTTAAEVVALVAGNAAASYLVTAAETVSGTVDSGTVGAQSLAGGSHLVFTASAAGTSGNAKRVRYVKAAAPGDPLDLQLSGNDLTVILENVAGNEDSTDTEIANAIAADATVSAFVTATAFGGTGKPVAATLVSYTNLSGGYDANSVTVDANLIGTTGINGSLYVEYRALSLKWTASASVATTGNDPQLVSASDSTTLESLVGELTDYNPLGLMMYLALQNNLGGTVYGLGVDEVSTSYPDGTNDAWTRASEFLTTETPYYLAIGSQRDAVHDIWISHINAVNGNGTTIPAQIERFLFINKEMPLMSPDTLIGSGDDLTGTGPTYTAGENFFLLGVQAGDILVVGDGTVGYTTLQDGTKGYPVLAAASGTPYTVEVNYPAPPANPSVTDEDWSIYRPGTSMMSGTTYLKDSIAETINQINNQIDNRKVSSTFPDNATISVDGSLKSLEGFYADAAQVGQCSAQKVSRSKFRQALTGIQNVRFSSDFFSADQMAVIQGGGTWTRHVPVAGGSVLTRHALTTAIGDNNPVLYNPTSAWQVDNYARLCRSIARRTLGSIISPELLQEIDGKISSVGRHLVDNKELAAADIVSIAQGDGSTASIDSVIIRGSVAPLQPNNKIKFYISISS